MMPTAAIALLLTSCATPPGIAPAAQGPVGESWRCRNDLEIQCGAGACTVAAGDGFTPMTVHVEGSGNLSVCAYSGCWEGLGEVLAQEPFLVIVGRGLEFSTAPRGKPDRQDVLVAIDGADSVGILKAGEFAHPLRCRRQRSS